jgi:16S rRNA processing protein RimM
VKENLILVGAFAGAVGLKGEVKLASFTAERAAIGRYGPLLAEDGRAFEIVSLRANSKGFAARVKGIDTREQAEALARVALYLPRAALPPPAGNEDYYVADLIGLQALTPNSETLGAIVAVQNFGAGDLLEVRLVGGERTILVPFTRAVVPGVDLMAKHVVIMAPKELLDDTPPPEGEDGNA